MKHNNPTQTQNAITAIPKPLAIKGSLLALHLLLIAVAVPITRLNDWPVLRWDYSYHYSQIAELGALMETHGSSWGYSDLFFAGYPVGINSNLGSKGWTWFVHLLSHVDIPTVLAFNLYIVLWAILTPLLIYQACRWFALSPLQATAATVVAMVYWWTSILYWYFSCGLISFLASAPLAMFSIAAFYAYSHDDGRWYHGVVFGLSAALCGWVHALSAVFLIIGCAIIYLARFRRLSLMQHVMLLLLGSIIAVAQWPWAEPYLELRKWFIEPNQPVLHLQPQGLSALHLDTVSNLQATAPLLLVCAGAVLAGMHLWRRDRACALLFLYGAVAFFLTGVLVKTPSHRLLLVGGIAGACVWWAQRKRTLFLLFTIFPLALLFLGYAGTQFTALQPARNIPVAYLWLAIPTAVGSHWAYDTIRQSEHHRRALGASLALLALGLWPVVSTQLTTVFAHEPITLISQPSPEADKLIHWLQTSTTREGRILFEDSLYWLAEHNVSAGYLAYTSQRAFVGGPFPWGGSVDFADGRPFDHPIETLTTDQMADYLRLYNIHWVIVYSETSRAYFDTQPGLVEPVEEFGYARIYRVKTHDDYFLEGTGQIAIREHQIELWDLQGPEIVLKYHWIPNLKSNPEITIERKMVPPDPHGFIKIVAPPDRLTIRVAP